MDTILLTLFSIVSFVVVTVGVLALAYYPLAILAEFHPYRPPVFETPNPLVSIIVPAYNEEKVIAHCVSSILSSEYPNYEVFLVNDGSKDGTLAVMQEFKDHPKVTVIDKPNGGKASALNAGYSQSKGEILFFVDADGMFTPTTVQEILNGFTAKNVGAVCGNDHPVNLDTLITKLYCLQTHVGTGFVRRALAQINCLPIISGNMGAFRRSVLEMAFIENGEPVSQDLSQAWENRRSGPYREGFIGEDLELTWRVHRTGYRVNFAPRAVVMAEVPSTVIGLWKQRVRWARGLLQTVRIHKDMFFNLKYGALGLYLPINFFNMVINPILQLLILIMAILLAFIGYSPFGTNILSFVIWLGLGGALFTAIFSVALNKAWIDLKYLYVVPLWAPYSIMMDVVMVWAIILELAGTEAQWNKLDRTGVVSRTSTAENKKG
jgi:biofilm PGA synthesis N-glycosyltransferase PgaC